MRKLQVHRPAVLAVAVALLAPTLTLASPQAGASGIGGLRAQEQDGIELLSGVITYEQTGPMMARGGMVAAFTLPGQAAASATALTEGGAGLMLDLLGGFAGSSLEDLSQSLDKARPDGDLPIDAKIEATIDFSLNQLADTGTWMLKSGSITWSASTTADIAYDGGRISDEYRGSGVETLDPGSDRIVVEITDDGSGQPRWSLEVDVDFAFRADGTSVWGIGDFASINLEVIGPDMRIEGVTPFGSTSALGMDPLIEGIFEDATESISFTRSGPVLDPRAPARDSWSEPDLIGVAVDGSIKSWIERCNPRIYGPDDGQQFVFSEDDPGELTGEGQLSGLPATMADDATWTFTPAGFDRYEPDDMVGDTIEFFSDELPDENSDFGEVEVGVKLADEAAAACAPVTPATVSVFFPRDARNNPSDNSNWFHYWLQTDARSGVEKIREAEKARCDRPNGEGVDGFFMTGAYYDGYINLCARTAEASIVLMTGALVEYIDSMAVTIVHEDRHRINWETWGRLPACDPAGNSPDPNLACMVDTDGDTVPDGVEPSPPLTAFPLDPLTSNSCRDVYGRYLAQWDDEHCIAYWAEPYWPADSIDDQDWASPGSQSE